MFSTKELISHFNLDFCFQSQEVCTQNDRKIQFYCYRHAVFKVIENKNDPSPTKDEQNRFETSRNGFIAF